jgi:PAS domain S-box-containing protein
LVLAVLTSGATARAGVGTPRTIRVVVDTAYAPYSFQSPTGQLQGILIDQWRAWERKTGIKVELHAMDWSEALRRMRAGEFDVIDSIVETPERRRYFDFTPGYASIEASIFFRDDISGITGLASLNGFPVGVKAGDQHIDRLTRQGVTTIILFRNNEQIVEAARRHKISVFVVDVPSALYLLSKKGIEADFRHSPPVFRDDLRRAVRKGNTELLHTVTTGFAAIDPAELKEIDEKWYGRTINQYVRYLTYAAYAAAVAILLILVLAGWNRMLRQKILQRTAALVESEQRFRQIAENIDEVFWLVDEATQTTLYVSPAYEAVWGRTRESFYREPRSIFNAIHPEDRARVEGVIERNREQPFEVEYRVVRPDGSTRWIRARGFPIRNEAGRFYRVAGIAEDITERRHAEEKLRATSEQLRALSYRLQSVREEEGIRIAREIHDELGGALTLLRWDLDGLAKMVPDLREKIAAMLALTDTTIENVRRIASELRPSVLDLVGGVEAIQWHGREFQERTGIVVHCDAPLDAVPLNQEQSTAAFRIFQEALTNILRHAQATRVDVTMAKEAGAFVLTITDNGVGITEDQKAAQSSIGLLGMQERAHLVGGEVEITGIEGGGTTVRVRLPVIPPGVNASTAPAPGNSP